MGEDRGSQSFTPAAASLLPAGTGFTRAGAHTTDGDPTYIEHLLPAATFGKTGPGVRLRASRAQK